MAGALGHAANNPRCVLPGNTKRIQNRGKGWGWGERGLERGGPRRLLSSFNSGVMNLPASLVRHQALHLGD